MEHIFDSEGMEFLGLLNEQAKNFFIYSKLCYNFLADKWHLDPKEKFIEHRLLGNVNVMRIKKGHVDAADKVVVTFTDESDSPKMAVATDLFRQPFGSMLPCYCLTEYGLGPEKYVIFDSARMWTLWHGRDGIHSNQSLGQMETIKFGSARTLVAFHGFKPMLEKRLYLVNVMREGFATYEALKAKLNLSSSPAGECDQTAEANSFNDTIMAEIAWIERTLPNVQSRVVFSRNDPNRTNILVRILNEWLLLLDCEGNSYGYRGVDIANEFFSEMFDVGGEMLNGKPYPSQETRRHFVETYLEECRKCSTFQSDWDEDGSDSVDHVLMEAAFFAVVDQLMRHIWVLKNHIFFTVMVKIIQLDRNDYGGPATTVRFYQQRKSEFLEKYPQFE